MSDNDEQRAKRQQNAALLAAAFIETDSSDDSGGELQAAAEDLSHKLGVSRQSLFGGLTFADNKNKSRGGNRRQNSVFNNSTTSFFTSSYENNNSGNQQDRSNSLTTTTPQYELDKDEQALRKLEQLHDNDAEADRLAVELAERQALRDKVKMARQLLETKRNSALNRRRNLMLRYGVAHFKKVEEKQLLKFDPTRLHPRAVAGSILVRLRDPKDTQASIKFDDLKFVFNLCVKLQIQTAQSSLDREATALLQERQAALLNLTTTNASMMTTTAVTPTTRGGNGNQSATTPTSKATQEAEKGGGGGGERSESLVDDGNYKRRNSSTAGPFSPSRSSSVVIGTTGTAGNTSAPTLFSPLAVSSPLTPTSIATPTTPSQTLTSTMTAKQQAAARAVAQSQFDDATIYIARRQAHLAIHHKEINASYFVRGVSIFLNALKELQVVFEDERSKYNLSKAMEAVLKNPESASARQHLRNVHKVRMHHETMMMKKVEKLIRKEFKHDAQVGIGADDDDIFTLVFDENNNGTNNNTDNALGDGVELSNSSFGAASSGRRSFSHAANGDNNYNNDGRNSSVFSVGEDGEVGGAMGGTEDDDAAAAALQASSSLAVGAASDIISSSPTSPYQQQQRIEFSDYKASASVANLLKDDAEHIRLVDRNAAATTTTANAVTNKETGNGGGEDNNKHPPPLSKWAMTTPSALAAGPANDSFFLGAASTLGVVVASPQQSGGTNTASSPSKRVEFVDLPRPPPPQQQSLQNSGGSNDELANSRLSSSGRGGGTSAIATTQKQKVSQHNPLFQSPLSNFQLTTSFSASFRPASKNKEGDNNTKAGGDNNNNARERERGMDIKHKFIASASIALDGSIVHGGLKNASTPGEVGAPNASTFAGEDNNQRRRSQQHRNSSSLYLSSSLNKSGDSTGNDDPQSSTSNQNNSNNNTNTNNSKNATMAVIMAATAENALAAVQANGVSEQEMALNPNHDFIDDGPIATRQGLAALFEAIDCTDVKRIGWSQLTHFLFEASLMERVGVVDLDTKEYELSGMSTHETHSNIRAMQALAASEKEIRKRGIQSKWLAQKIKMKNQEKLSSGLTGDDGGGFLSDLTFLTFFEPTQQLFVGGADLWWVDKGPGLKPKLKVETQRDTFTQLPVYSVVCTAYVHSLRILAVSCTDSTVKFYHMSAGNVVAPKYLTSVSFQCNQTAVYFRGEVLYTGSRDGELATYQLAYKFSKGLRASKLLQVHPHRNIIRKILEVKHEKCIVTCSFDHTIQMHDVKSLRHVHTFGPGHSRGVVDIAFCDPLNVLVSIAFDGTPYVWALSLVSGPPSQLHDGNKSHKHVPVAVVSIDHHRAAATLDRSGMVKIWDLRDLCCMQTIYVDAHVPPAEKSVKFVSMFQRWEDPSGTSPLGCLTLYIISQKRIFTFVYNQSQAKVVLRNTADDDQILHAAWCPWDLSYITIAAGNSVRTWDGETCAVRDTFKCSKIKEEHGGSITAATTHPVGRQYYVGTSDGSVFAKSSSTGMTVYSAPKAHTAAVKYIIYCQAPRTSGIGSNLSLDAVVSLSDDKAILMTGELKDAYHLADVEHPRSVAYDSETAMLLIGDTVGAITAYQLGSFAPCRGGPVGSTFLPKSLPREITCLCALTGEQSFVAADDEGHIAIFNQRTADRPFACLGLWTHVNETNGVPAITAMCFDSERYILYCGDEQGFATIYNIYDMLRVPVNNNNPDTANTLNANGRAITITPNSFGRTASNLSKIVSDNNNNNIAGRTLSPMPSFRVGNGGVGNGNASASSPSSNHRSTLTAANVGGSGSGSPFSPTNSSSSVGRTVSFTNQSNNNGNNNNNSITAAATSPLSPAAVRRRLSVGPTAVMNFYAAGRRVSVINRWLAHLETITSIALVFSNAQPEGRGVNPATTNTNSNANVNTTAASNPNTNTNNSTTHNNSSTTASATTMQHACLLTASNDQCAYAWTLSGARHLGALEQYGRATVPPTPYSVAHDFRRVMAERAVHQRDARVDTMRVRIDGLVKVPGQRCVSLIPKRMLQSGVQSALVGNIGAHLLNQAFNARASDEANAASYATFAQTRMMTIRNAKNNNGSNDAHNSSNATAGGGASSTNNSSPSKNVTTSSHSTNRTRFVTANHSASIAAANATADAFLVFFADVPSGSNKVNVTATSSPSATNDDKASKRKTAKKKTNTKDKSSQQAATTTTLRRTGSILATPSKIESSSDGSDDSDTASAGEINNVVLDELALIAEIFGEEPPTPQKPTVGGKEVKFAAVAQKNKDNNNNNSNATATTVSFSPALATDRSATVLTIPSSFTGGDKQQQQQSQPAIAATTTATSSSLSASSSLSPPPPPLSSTTDYTQINTTATVTEVNDAIRTLLTVKEKEYIQMLSMATRAGVDSIALGGGGSSNNRGGKKDAQKEKKKNRRGNADENDADDDGRSQRLAAAKRQALEQILRARDRYIISTGRQFLSGHPSDKSVIARRKDEEEKKQRALAKKMKNHNDDGDVDDDDDYDGADSLSHEGPASLLAMAGGANGSGGGGGGGEYANGGAGGGSASSYPAGFVGCNYITKGDPNAKAMIDEKHGGRRIAGASAKDYVDLGPAMLALAPMNDRKTPSPRDERSDDDDNIIYNAFQPKGKKFVVGRVHEQHQIHLKQQQEAERERQRKEKRRSTTTTSSDRKWRQRVESGDGLMMPSSSSSSVCEALDFNEDVEQRVAMNNDSDDKSNHDDSHHHNIPVFGLTVEAVEDDDDDTVTSASDDDNSSGGSGIGGAAIRDSFIAFGKDDMSASGRRDVHNNNMASSINVGDLALKTQPATATTTTAAITKSIGKSVTGKNTSSSSSPPKTAATTASAHDGAIKKSSNSKKKNAVLSSPSLSLAASPLTNKTASNNNNKKAQQHHQQQPTRAIDVIESIAREITEIRLLKLEIQRYAEAVEQQQRQEAEEQQQRGGNNNNNFNRSSNFNFNNSMMMAMSGVGVGGNRLLGAIGGGGRSMLMMMNNSSRRSGGGGGGGIGSRKSTAAPAPSSSDQKSANAVAPAATSSSSAAASTTSVSPRSSSSFFALRPTTAPKSTSDDCRANDDDDVDTATTTTDIINATNAPSSTSAIDHTTRRVVGGDGNEHPLSSPSSPPPPSSPSPPPPPPPPDAERVLAMESKMIQLRNQKNPYAEHMFVSDDLKTFPEGTFDLRRGFLGKQCGTTDGARSAGGSVSGAVGGGNSSVGRGGGMSKASFASSSSSPHHSKIKLSVVSGAAGNGAGGSGDGAASSSLCSATPPFFMTMMGSSTACLSPPNLLSRADENNDDADDDDAIKKNKKGEEKDTIEVPSMTLSPSSSVMRRHHADGADNEPQTGNEQKKQTHQQREAAKDDDDEKAFMDEDGDNGKSLIVSPVKKSDNNNDIITNNTNNSVDQQHGSVSFGVSFVNGSGGRGVGAGGALVPEECPSLLSSTRSPDNNALSRLLFDHQSQQPPLQRVGGVNPMPSATSLGSSPNNNNTIGGGGSSKKSMAERQRQLLIDAGDLAIPAPRKFKGVAVDDDGVPIVLASTGGGTASTNSPPDGGKKNGKNKNGKKMTTAMMGSEKPKLTILQKVQNDPKLKLGGVAPSPLEKIRNSKRKGGAGANATKPPAGQEGENTSSALPPPPPPPTPPPVLIGGLTDEERIELAKQHFPPMGTHQKVLKKVLNEAGMEVLVVAGGGGGGGGGVSGGGGGGGGGGMLTDDSMTSMNQSFGATINTSAVQTVRTAASAGGGGSATMAAAANLSSHQQQSSSPSPPSASSPLLHLTPTQIEVFSKIDQHMLSIKKAIVPSQRGRLLRRGLLGAGYVPPIAVFRADDDEDENEDAKNNGKEDGADEEVEDDGEKKRNESEVIHQQNEVELKEQEGVDTLLLHHSPLRSPSSFPQQGRVTAYEGGHESLPLMTNKEIMRKANHNKTTTKNSSNNTLTVGDDPDLSPATPHRQSCDDTSSDPTPLPSSASPSTQQKERTTALAEALKKRILAGRTASSAQRRDDNKADNANNNDDDDRGHRQQHHHESASTQSNTMRRLMVGGGGGGGAYRQPLLDLELLEKEGVPITPAMMEQFPQRRKKKGKNKDENDDEEHHSHHHLELFSDVTLIEPTTGRDYDPSRSELLRNLDASPFAQKVMAMLPPRPATAVQTALLRSEMYGGGGGGSTMTAMNASTTSNTTAATVAANKHSSLQYTRPPTAPSLSLSASMNHGNGQQHPPSSSSSLAAFLNASAPATLLQRTTSPPTHHNASPSAMNGGKDGEERERSAHSALTSACSSSISKERAGRIGGSSGHHHGGDSRGVGHVAFHEHTPTTTDLASAAFVDVRKVPGSSDGPRCTSALYAHRADTEALLSDVMPTTTALLLSGGRRSSGEGESSDAYDKVGSVVRGVRASATTRRSLSANHSSITKNTSINNNNSVSSRSGDGNNTFLRPSASTSKHRLALETVGRRPVLLLNNSTGPQLDAFPLREIAKRRRRQREQQNEEE